MNKYELTKTSKVGRIPGDVTDEDVVITKKVSVDTESYNIHDKLVTLYQIKALKDFNDVNEGDLGGWVESEDNLSQEGNCWVYQDSEAIGDTSKITGYSEVRKSQVIDSQVCNSIVINSPVTSSIIDISIIYNSVIHTSVIKKEAVSIKLFLHGLEISEV